MMILRNGKRLITGDQERSAIKKRRKIDREENKRGRVFLNNRNKIDQEENKTEKLTLKKRKQIDAEELISNESFIVKKGKKIDQEQINNQISIVPSMGDDPPPCKDLPEELVIQSILTRLSARKLAVCSSVSKLWYNTVYDDAQFATSHFVQNQNKLSLFFNILNFRRVHSKKAFIFNLEEKDNNGLDLKNLAILDTKYRNELVGYCNGLACFEAVREDLKIGVTEGVITVLNPTRDETLFLSYLIPPGDYIHLCHGFGFDASSQEYKIVVIFVSKANGEFVSKVITLGSSSWRTITTATDILLPPGFPIPKRMVTSVSRPLASGTLCGGDLFWKITNEVFEEDDVINDNSSNKIEMLLSFDLHNEKIKFIGLPAESIYTPRLNEHPFYAVYHLLEFKGYPCVARFEKIVASNNDHRCKYLSRRWFCCCCCKVHLYTLKDKVEQVWIKGDSFDIQFNKEFLPTAQLGCYFETTPPRILSCSNQVLLYWFNGECLILYNLQTKYVQLVKGSRFYPHVFPKLKESPVVGYVDTSFFWSVENQLHAQVENMLSLKSFIPEGGETIQSNCQADIERLVGNRSPVGWLMTEKMMMIYELEREVIQIQSGMHDMHIPKTSLEIALIKLSLFQKGEIKKLRLKLSHSEKLVDEAEKLKASEIVKHETRVSELESQLDYKTELQNEMENLKGSEIEKFRARVAELEKQLSYETGLQEQRDTLKVVELVKLQTTVWELQKKLDYKTELRIEVEVIEKEVEMLQTKFALLKKQADDKTDEVKRSEETVDELTKSLSEKTECIESLEDLNKNLIVKERLHNDELQQARKTLIQGIEESAHCRSSIRVRRMGELDSKPFGKALKRKCSSSLADVNADESVMLCNFWEKMLKNQAWHPFKQVTLVDGIYQELIDGEDTLLKSLKNEWGKRAYSAVVNALVEMNEYNPSGRIPVQELWNFKEKRRATVKEGVAALIHRLRKHHTPTAAAITFTK